MEIDVYCYKGSTRKNQIVKAINIINGVQNYFFFKLQSEMDLDVCEETLINWEDFCEKHSQKNEKYIIYITEKSFDDNWFSHEESQYSIITTSDWEEHFAPPSLKAYLVYQMAQAALSFEGDLNEMWVHSPPLGAQGNFNKIEKHDTM